MSNSDYGLPEAKLLAGRPLRNSDFLDGEIVSQVKVGNRLFNVRWGMRTGWSSLPFSFSLAPAGEPAPELIYTSPSLRALCEDVRFTAAMLAVKLDSESTK